ncbi:hypothetical protein CHEID_07320 [Corynebacterium heidelbergense]|nr:hypothetical protein CHEID_07320 [Corynebacterium heidelbergense]
MSDEKPPAPITAWHWACTLAALATILATAHCAP